MSDRAPASATVRQNGSYTYEEIVSIQVSFLQRSAITRRVLVVVRRPEGATNLAAARREAL